MGCHRGGTTQPLDHPGLEPLHRLGPRVHRGDGLLAPHLAPAPRLLPGGDGGLRAPRPVAAARWMFQRLYLGGNRVHLLRLHGPEVGVAVIRPRPWLEGGAFPRLQVRWGRHALHEDLRGGRQMPGMLLESENSGSDHLSSFDDDRCGGGDVRGSELALGVEHDTSRSGGTSSGGSSSHDNSDEPPCRPPRSRRRTPTRRWRCRSPGLGSGGRLEEVSLDDMGPAGRVRNSGACAFILMLLSCVQIIVVSLTRLNQFFFMIA